MSKKLLFFVIAAYSCLTSYAAFAHVDGGLAHTHGASDYEQIEAAPEASKAEPES
jgi:hypothetical protein